MRSLAAFYEPVLKNVVVLAMFIPIVLALAESVSIQSLTLTLQVHDIGQRHWKNAVPALPREAMIGVVLGAACGLLVGMVAWLWQGKSMVAACILLSIVLAVTTAAVLGLAIPTLLRALRRDPKVAAGPITLALTDIATLFYYLGLATALLE